MRIKFDTALITGSSRGLGGSDSEGIWPVKLRPNQNMNAREYRTGPLTSHSGCSFDFLDSEFQPAPQKVPQGGGIGISDAGSDFIDGRVAGFQQMHRTLNTQTLEIGQRGFAQHRMHAARERSLAGRNRPGSVFQGESLFQSGASPIFKALDKGVGVGQMIS